MNVQKTCPTCGSTIPGDAADGLCLKCLGRLGFCGEGADSPAYSRLRLGDYELLAEVARGGMGVVYRARQMSLNRIVALKVVLHGPFSSPDFVRRFRTEAQAIAALRHPNIVAIHEIGEHNGNHFISLEFVEGRNFAELARAGPLPAARSARYVQLVAEAVEHAHRRGVLHRDLKPSNILLDMFDQPRVTDFGLAKLVDQDAELTITGQVLGSPHYMSPEQALGRFSEATARSDVYSLGAILYELLTGRPPFQGETLPAVLAQVQDAEPVPPRRLNPGTPVDLQTICLKCLQKEPARRYATAQELADDLDRFLDKRPIRARPRSLLARGALWCRRRPLLACLSGGFIAAIGLGVTGIIAEWRQADFQRSRAEADAAETRLNLYAADMAVASQAIQNGNFGLACATLKRLRPKAGEVDLRGFEWRYLRNVCRGDQIAVLAGHTRTVTCIAFSPGGALLATGSQDGTVRIWAVAQRKTIATLNLSSNAACSVAFTPDGRHLLTGYDHCVAYWSTDTWEREKGLPGEIMTVAEHGDLMATADSSPFYWEPAGPVRLFNWRTGRLQAQLEQPGRALALSPDGSLLAVAGVTNGFTIWDTATGRLLEQRPTMSFVGSLNFSPDGRRLLAAGWSSNISIWQRDDHSPLTTFSCGQLNSWSAIFSRDGATIVTTSSDQTVRFWDATSLALKNIRRGHASEVWCAAFSPDGNLLATGSKDQTAMLWSVAPPASAPGQLPHDRDFRPLFSPDGKWLATVDRSRGCSVLWRLDDRSENHAFAGPRIAGFSPDGTLAITFDEAEMKLQRWSLDGQTLKTEVRLNRADGHSAGVDTVGMSPDQRHFFAIDADGFIRIWDADTGRLRRTLQGPAPPIRNAVLSAGANHLAVCVERDNVAHLFDCATGQARELAGHADFISGLAFSPGDCLLATGSVDGTIRLWDVRAGTSVSILQGHMEEATDVAISPDGRTLASLGHGEALRLWHLPTRREVLSETMRNAGLYLQFAPDGRTLAVTTDDNIVRLLDAPAGE